MDTIILKKVVTALLYPASIIVISGCLMVIFKKHRAVKLSQFCYLMFIVSFLLSTNLMFARWLTHSLEKQYPQTSIENIQQHDAIIILGGGLRIPIPPAKQTQLSSASDRYWYAVQLYRAGKAKRILISAGNVIEQNGLYGEAVYARELLELWGVPSQAITIETESRTTKENQQQVLFLIQQHNIDSALLVTSALHMPRAYNLFKELPIKIAMQLTTVALHEYYAMWYGRLKAVIFKS